MLNIILLHFYLEKNTFTINELQRLKIAAKQVQTTQMEKKSKYQSRF